jgi:hypothetical protein
MSNEETKKIQYFEYFLDKLYNHLGHQDSNDLSIVKSLKLVFFLVNSIEDSKEGIKYPLLDKFNNFYALPLGHVESDIYKAIKNIEDFKLNNFEITRFGTKLLNGNLSIISNDIYTDMIDRGFEKLIEFDLINKTGNYLVNLSHCHNSWIKNYNIALQKGKNSEKISDLDFKAEQKYFAL